MKKIGFFIIVFEFIQVDSEHPELIFLSYKFKYLRNTMHLKGIWKESVVKMYYFKIRNKYRDIRKQ